VTRAHLKEAAVIWEGSIRENESLFFLFVCLEVEMSLRVMRPTSSDAKKMGGGGGHVGRCILPYQRPFAVCEGARE
jgi:hypothetical protein